MVDPAGAIGPPPSCRKVSAISEVGPAVDAASGRPMDQLPDPSSCPTVGRWRTCSAKAAYGRLVAEKSPFSWKEISRGGPESVGAYQVPTRLTGRISTG